MRGNKVIREISVGLAFFKTDMKIATSYKMQFGFQFLQIFFSITLIYFIGKMIEVNGSSRMLSKYGGNYFAFALVGIAVNSYLRAGLVTITNNIRQLMNQGVLESLCATDVKYSLMLLYMSLWQFIFETFRVAVYFFAGWIVFGVSFQGANWLTAMVVMMLTIPVFMLLGMISSSILIVVKKGDPVNWFFSSAGALLGGTMFPVEILPVWAKKISAFIPLTHSLEGMRKAVLMGDTLAGILPNLQSLGIFLIILVPVSLLLCNWCMDVAKNNGSLATH